ncbi:MAG: hypothetical protein V1767_07545 [Chloroflexota bacterium]
MARYKETDKSRRTAKIIQGVCIFAVIVFVDILRRGIALVTPWDSGTLNLLTGVLAGVGLVDLAASYLVPQWMIKGYRQKPWLDKGRFLISVYIIRAGLLESVAIYGLVLGILGVRVEFVLPFIIVSVGGLFITFPTDEKWKGMTATINRR